MNVIAQVEKTTDWASKVVVARKKNGDLRICIDPHAQNKALKREIHQLTTLDDILPELSMTLVFSTIDLKSGYWLVSPDEASSLLTTSTTPYGSYRWLRMPFRCNVSSEIFQKKLQQAIEGLEGVHYVLHTTSCCMVLVARTMVKLSRIMTRSYRLFYSDVVTWESG